MNIIIIGIGSVARNVTDILNSEFNYQIKGFLGSELEATKYANTIIYQGIPFLGGRKILRDIKQHDIDGFIVATGDRYLREEIYNEAKASGLIPINSISKNTIFDGKNTLGSGIIIGSGSIIQNGVTIGDNVRIGSSVILDYECRIESNCNIGTGSYVGRRTVIKKNCHLGIKTSINENIEIGKNHSILDYTNIEKNLTDLPRPNPSVNE